MKKLLIAVMAVFSTVVMIGCGKDGGGGNNVVNPTVQTCAAGSVWNGTACIIPHNTVSGNFRFGITNCNGYSCGNTSGFTVSNIGAYQDFLEKGLGVCSTVRTIGVNDCKNWWPGGFEIVIQGTYNPANNCFAQTGQVTPSSVTMYTKASYVSSGVFDYGGQFMSPYFPYRNGATYNSVASDIANCEGFTFRTQYGLYTLELQVKKGNLRDGSLSYVLYWGSQTYNPSTPIASGILQRY